MIQRSLLCIHVVFLSIVCFWGSVIAESAVARDLAVREEKLGEVSQKLEREQRRQAGIKAEKRSILDELNELDARIVTQWEDYDRLRRQWTEKESRLVEVQAEHDRIRADLERRKMLVETRLRALLRMGPVGTLNVLFSAESFSEIISRGEFLRHVLARDRELWRGYEARLVEIAETEKILEREREEFMTASRDLEASTRLLEERKRDREVFFEKVVAEEERSKRAMKELKAAKRSMGKVVEGLRGVEASSRSDVVPFVPVDKFADQKGKLALPVVKGRIAPPGRNSLRGKTPGLVIEAPMGSETRALFDGVVVYVGALEGYGDVVIMDHGDLYYSLVAQCMKIFKKVGQKVFEGEPIGLSGGGPWIQEGVYVEIRHQGSELDPRAWIDSRFAGEAR